MQRLRANRSEPQTDASTASGLELLFARCECLGPTSEAVLDAIDQRVRSLRASGWAIPEDARVHIRHSGFGFAASLVMPKRLQQSDLARLKRANRSSGILSKLATEPAKHESP